MLWLNHVCSSDVGEVLGFSYAIQWVHELQFINVDFEFDAKKVVDYFNEGSNAISDFGAIIDKCRRSCNNSHFKNSKVEFSSKQGSAVVHTLARETNFLTIPCVF